MARPTIYTEELASEICSRIVLGESLKSICSSKSMPCIATIFNWFDQKKGFLEKYDKAKEEQAETFADELLEIADNGTNDYMETLDGENTAYKLNGENIQRSRLRVDARKWLMSKYKQKRFGDKVTNDHAGSVDLKVVTNIPSPPKDN